ncbi:MAG: PIN domain-containing protein [Candidatus Tectomicrobia bacterium]|uniref:PIN domain-containing protein n=1 Tax=Tectimicrobiota bacterium TaxID=2528274 RepID=A0A932MMH0_UNCTE|nr:PIN domain-containing protein [Candidatus Tectomicrobia bacterium]
MKMVFADSFYWIARVHPRDQGHEAAKKAREDLGEVQIVTTDEVLVEFLNALSSKGEYLRRQAVKMVQTILKDPDVVVVPQSRDSFMNGLELFKNRPDKEYSLTDCISMSVMWKEGLLEILTGDHHFEQEGFTVLIRKV